MYQKRYQKRISIFAYFLVSQLTQSGSVVLAANGHGQIVNAVSADSPDYKASTLCIKALKDLDNGQYKEAQASLEEACKFDPNQASCMVHTNLGLVMEHFNKFDQAFKHLTLALKFSPTDKSALIDMGSYYQQMGDIPKATPYFQKYLSLYPTSPDAVTLRQLLAMFKKANIGKVDENAIDYYKEATGGKPVRFKKNLLSVYFEPPNGVSQFHDNYAAILTASLNEWMEASKVLSWAPTTDKASADIVCKWVNTLLDAKGKPKVETGEAMTQHLNGNIHMALIQLSTLPKTDTEITDDGIKYMCLHEVGHALGLLQHSPHRDDIMFFSERANQAPALSDRDKNTIEKLYAN